MKGGREEKRAHARGRELEGVDIAGPDL